MNTKAKRAKTTTMYSFMAMDDERRMTTSNTSSSYKALSLSFTPATMKRSYVITTEINYYQRGISEKKILIWRMNQNLGIAYRLRKDSS
jgi:hypothetical protein